MSKLLLIALVAMVAFVCAASAHKAPRRPQPALSPYGLASRAKRTVTASTCSYMTCAVSGGSCSSDGSSLIFCQVGQYCNSTTCVTDKNLGDACNINAPENECGSGRCVNSVCQIYQEIMPGNACTNDTQCYYSEDVAGTSVISLCQSGVCYGRTAGEACLASHQCYVGYFCASATMTCTALGSVGATCSADSECNSRYTCLNSVCSKRYTQGKGETCSATENCKSGYYCSSSTKKCTAGSEKGRTTTACDIQSSTCGSDMECSCATFTKAGTSATCSAIPSTYKDMATVEDTAYACLDKYSCGEDVNNNSTVTCITNNCLSSYCTYFTRSMNDMFTMYPTCLVNRMVGSQQYATLLSACTSYVPTSKDQTSAGSVLSAAFAWTVLLLSSIFFFGF